MAYNLILDHGIRPDGRKESFIVYINDEGKSMGLYYLEGEEPVVSEDVGFETEWFLQPCVDDRTVIPVLFEELLKHIGVKGRCGVQHFGMSVDGNDPKFHGCPPHRICRVLPSSIIHILGRRNINNPEK